MAKTKGPTKVDLAVQLAGSQANAEYYRNKFHEEQVERQKDRERIHAEAKVKELELVAKITASLSQSNEAFARMVCAIRNY